MLSLCAPQYILIIYSQVDKVKKNRSTEIYAKATLNIKGSGRSPSFYGTNPFVGFYFFKGLNIF